MVFLYLALIYNVKYMYGLSFVSLGSKVAYTGEKVKMVNQCMVGVTCRKPV